MAEPARFSRDEILAVETPLFRQSRRVKFQDVDAAATIYYSRVFEYFGDAYLDLLIDTGIDAPGMLAKKELASPVIVAEAEYLAPLRFGDEVSVEIALLRLGETSVSIGFRIIRADGVPATVGRTTNVWVNPNTFRPTPLHPKLRERFGRG